MNVLELFHYTFFQHALLGSLFASIACGIIGTYIVTRRLVFISGGITHASFGGIGIGLYAGISPILSAAIFSVLSAFGVEWLSKRSDMREDSAIAVFWTFGMAVGIIFSFLAPGFTPDLSSFLFGNILTINRSDITLLAILSVALILFFTLFLRPITAISVCEAYEEDGISGWRTFTTEEAKEFRDQYDDTIVALSDMLAENGLDRFNKYDCRYLCNDFNSTFCFYNTQIVKSGETVDYALRLVKKVRVEKAK